MKTLLTGFAFLIFMGWLSGIITFNEGTNSDPVNKVESVVPEITLYHCDASTKYGYAEYISAVDNNSKIQYQIIRESGVPERKGSGKAWKFLGAGIFKHNIIENFSKDCVVAS